MFTLRCTHKLLARLGAAPGPEQEPPDTVLGDWYANLIRVGRAQWVIAISERTLLAVVVPAKEGRTLAERISRALEPLLLTIGVPSDQVLAERKCMSAAAIGKTADRRILGSLNDLAFQLEVGLLRQPEVTLLGQALWLAQTPLKLIDYQSPQVATLAAFAARAEPHGVAQSQPFGQ